MRITEISILDTYGTYQAKFAPGSVTVISGANGEGKSSILRALAYVFAGGTDPSVVRNGAEKSIVSFKLDDGTVVTKTTRPKRKRGQQPGAPVEYVTDLEIVQSDGTIRQAPQTYINELAESISIDPSQILRIDATTVPGRKQLAEILLRIMLISFGPAEIDEAVRYRAFQVGKTPIAEIGKPCALGDLYAVARTDRSQNDLDGIKKLIAAVTDTRRLAGKTRDDCDGAINRLRASLPPDTEGARNYGELLAEAEDFRRTVESAIQDRMLEIEKQAADARLLAQRIRGEETAKINADIEERIRALEAERASRTAVVNQQHVEGLNKISVAVAGHIADLDRESKPQLERAIADAQQLKDKLAASQRAAGLREEIGVQQSTLERKAWEYEELTGVIRRLEKLRQDKLDSLPVAGLEVSGETVSIDGVPWQNVNLARRVEVALQLCALRSGKLGLLLCDDSEHLDSETSKALQDGIAAAGYQMIAARVTDSPLKIEVVAP